MYLINVESCTLKRFDTDPPPYAILSHRWRDDEVSFQDFQDVGQRAKQKGLAKILQMCALTQRNGLEWAWIDTCCIDKSSSAELSEAINSMFKWYQNSKVCYVYWDDVAAGDGESYLDDVCASMSNLSSTSGTQEVGTIKSEWFERGWTLQELIAPIHLDFYNSQWHHLGSKWSLADRLSRITKIDVKVFESGTSLSDFSVATKMSWAAERKTTREEDIAYCLLGLFNVNMPLLYGEGPKAFIRLQEEIVKAIDDQTVFAWKEELNAPVHRGLFAPTPKAFASTVDQHRVQDLIMATQIDSTARGLRTKTTVCLTSEMETELDLPPLYSYLLLPLNCTSYSNLKERKDVFSAILLVRIDVSQYFRFRPEALYEVHESQISRDTTIFIEKEQGKLQPGPPPSRRPSSQMAPAEFFIQLPDEGMNLINTSSTQGRGRYDYARSIFYTDVPVLKTESKFVFGLAFDVGHGAIILVTIEIFSTLFPKDWRPLGYKMTAFLMGNEEDDVHLVNSCKHKVEELGRSKGVTRVKPPLVMTQDLIMQKTRKLTTDTLRLSLKRVEGAYRGLRFVMRLSFIGSRSWASTKLKLPKQGLVGIQSIVDENYM